MQEEGLTTCETQSTRGICSSRPKKLATLVIYKNHISVIKQHMFIQLVITFLTNNKVVNVYRRSNKIYLLLTSELTSFTFISLNSNHEKYQLSVLF